MTSTLKELENEQSRKLGDWERMIPECDEIDIGSCYLAEKPRKIAISFKKKITEMGSDLTDFPAEIFHFDLVVWYYLRNITANSTVRANALNSSSLANTFSDGYRRRNILPPTCIVLFANTFDGEPFAGVAAVQL